MFRVTQKIGNFRFKKQLQTENKYNKKYWPVSNI